MALDTTVNGVALTSDGFINSFFVNSPVALVTFGLIDGCADIWTNTDQTITTVWVNAITQDTVETCTGP